MIEDDPRLDPDDLRSASFPGSFRRYEARAVEQYLASLADRVAETNALIDDLDRQLGAALEQAAAASASSFDGPDLQSLGEDELARLLGDETAHVLTTARRAAEEIRSKAEESAARMIREATAEANRMIETAQDRVVELTSEAENARDVACAAAEADAERIRQDAERDAHRVLADANEQAREQLESVEARRIQAQDEAAEVLVESREEGKQMVAEARRVRARVLEDLQRRRAIGRSQVERLAAGRDKLLAAYDVVRENLDEITAHLHEALPESATADADAPSDAEVDLVLQDLADEDAAVVDVVVADVDGSEDGELEETGALGEAGEAGGTDRRDEPDEAPLDEAADPDRSPVAEDTPAAEPPGEPPGERPAESNDVDALFARIRAERAESVARAQRVLSSDTAVATIDRQQAAPADEPAEAPADAFVEPVPDDADHDHDHADGDVERVSADLLASGPVWEHRNATVAALDKKLSRALKRVLSDEQNEVLDALRRTESTDPAELLPSVTDHVGAYASVAATELTAAATAGASQVDPEAVVDGSELADTLGRTLIEPFRRRIERTAAGVEGDADELDERLRAIYREWKVEHIGAATHDALLDAYAHGQHAAAPDGAALRWLIDPAQGPCPDAQDNALAGVVHKGSAFPTGDACPQAHPGCLCLLAVD